MTPAAEEDEEEAGMEEVSEVWIGAMVGRPRSCAACRVLFAPLPGYLFPNCYGIMCSSLFSCTVLVLSVNVHILFFLRLGAVRLAALYGLSV